MKRPHSPTHNDRFGLILGFSAYILWGILPPYFIALEPSSPIEIVGIRVLFSLLFCLLLVWWGKKGGQLRRVFTEPHLRITFIVAGVLIFINWTTYLYATLTENVLQAALGYFINPIMTILLGVFVLGEKLKTLQWFTVALTIGAVVVLTIDYGQLPWISLILATSFALYGLFKKRAGVAVDSIVGLTAETAFVSPLAVIMIVVAQVQTGLTFGTLGTWHTILFLLIGVVTAVPLVLFGSAAQRVPLTTLGLMQYLAPVMQFLYGYLMNNEAMSPARWVGFILIWIALIISSSDLFIGRSRAYRISTKTGT